MCVVIRPVVAEVVARFAEDETYLVTVGGWAESVSSKHSGGDE